MTAATNPAFNRAAWEGTKPLVEPEEHRPFEVGDLVALVEPVNDNGDPVVRGVVLFSEVDEDGEQTLTIARELNRDPDQPRFEGWRFARETHPASAFERSPKWWRRSSRFDRTWSNAAAARICMALGQRHSTGSGWNNESRFLLGGALVLTDIDHHEPPVPARDAEASNWEENRG